MFGLVFDLAVSHSSKGAILMRWSEERLKQHLKTHGNRKIEAVAEFKIKNDAKVYQAKQSVLNRKLERNSKGEEKVILDCEIAATPPSVNHYWVASGKKRFLSDKARDFHSVIEILVPALGSESRLKLDVTFHFPDRKVRDIDNYLKATIDSLVKCGLCVDDEQFDELIVKRGPVVKGGLLKLKVSEI